MGCFGQSLEGTDRIATIVAQLKNFAHLEDMEQQPLDIKRELEQLLAGLESQFPPNTQVMTDLHPLPLLASRVPLMVQAFANILDNALKSRSEGVELTVRTRQNGDQMLISICDNGCGILPENLPRIFEPFFTTREVGSGTGMGLTVVREAIIGAGGTIEVESIVVQGTVCRVFLPLPRSGQ